MLILTPDALHPKYTPPNPHNNHIPKPVNPKLPKTSKPKCSQGSSNHSSLAPFLFLGRWGRRRIEEIKRGKFRDLGVVLRNYSIVFSAMRSPGVLGSNGGFGLQGIGNRVQGVGFGPG